MMRSFRRLSVCAAAVLLFGATVAAYAQEAPRAEHITSELTETLDLPFSEVVRVGDMLYLSGMVGVRPGTLELVPGGLPAEARRTMENIRLMLAAAGATPEDVVKCTVMLDDIERWSEFNEVYAEFFGDHRPARSAFGADGLALGSAVEVECMAVAPGSAGAGTR